jgi:high-affinity Fe2+/Pb2+ permease
MDFSSVTISALILLYGVYEYRRREKAHSAAMEHLRRGEAYSGVESAPPAWNLITTGSVCVLLAGFAAMLFYTGLHSHNNSAGPLEIMGGMMTVPLVILVLIFVRDLRRHAGSQLREKETGR